MEKFLVKLKCVFCPKILKGKKYEQKSIQHRRGFWDTIW